MRDYKFPLLYVSWIALCALLFIALRGVEDPSRRPGRVLGVEAGQMALRHWGNPGYEVVQVAWARAGEGAPEERWVVLLDKKPRTGLRDAVVVEIRAEDGRVLRVRKPVR